MLNRLLAHPLAPWILLPALLGLGFFAGLGALPLFDVDEGAFSAATWEMLQRGDWITPWLYGEPRFDKPILSYWMQALSVLTFGVNEWAFRFPSAVAASLWALAIYRFTRRYYDQGRALMAAALATSSAGVFLIGHAATADALLNLFFALALLDIYNQFRQPKAATLYRIWLWIGLAVLTKGPIGILIPVVVSFVFYLLEGQWRSWLQSAFNPRGWLILLAVALPWYALEYLAQGQAFIDGFFLKHNIGRFTNTMEGHGGLVYYYLVVAFLIVLPYTGLLASTAATFWRNWRADPLSRFLLIWFGFVFLFFSFSSTQLPHYLLYGSTPLFILMAKRLDEQPNAWLLVIPTALIGLLLFFLPEVVGNALQHTKNGFQREVLALAAQQLSAGYRLAAGLYLLAILSGLALIKRSPRLWVMLAGFAQMGFLSLALLPAVANTQQQPLLEAARIAREQGETTVMWGMHMPSFEIRRGAVTPRRAPRPDELAITHADHLPDAPPHELLYQRGGLALIRRLP